MDWNGLKNVVKAMVDSAQAIFTPQVYTARKQQQNTVAIVQSNTALAERREEMQVAQLKLQYIQEKERQEYQAEQSYLSNQRSKESQERQLAFQAEQARLSQQRQEELQKYIQQVQIAINGVCQENCVKVQIIEVNDPQTQ